MAAALETCGNLLAIDVVKETVQTGADKALAFLLHRAISSTEDRSREELMARATRDFRRQTFSECSFRDDIWEPALEFMAIMGLGPADVFRRVLAGFDGVLTQRVEESPRGVLEQILPEIFPYCESYSMRRLLVLVLRRLGELPRCKGAVTQPVEDDALSCLARNLSDEAERALIPLEIQRRLPSGCDPVTFPEVVQPVLSDAIEWLHSGTGVGLAEEALRALAYEQASELRSNFHSVRRLADLVGPSCDLYQILRKLISKKSHEAVSSLQPIFRRQPLKGEIRGAPVSLGPEPFLSTLRSQLLLVMVERNILQKSLSGTWNISSQTAGKPHVFQYLLHISHHHGGTISGKSTLMQGFDVDGELSTSGCSSPGGLFLSFRQESPKQVYTCTCEVMGNLQEIRDGQWRNKDGTVAGTFTGRRLGDVSYADYRGQVWDETAHLVVLLDSMHGKRTGLDDELCEELQQVASRSCAARSEAAQPAGSPVAGSVSDLEASARHVLADMNVVHSLIRTVVYWRKQKADDALHAPLDHRERFALFLLLWSVHAITCDPSVNTLQPVAPKRKLKLSGVVRQLDEEGTLLRAPIFEQLRQGPPSEEALSRAGLRGDLLAASLWRFFQPRNDADAGPPGCEQGGATAGLRQALELARADLPKFQTAFAVLRLANNYMANYAIIRRSTSLLKESLALAREFDPVPHGQSPDWVTRQLVDILVNSGIYLGTFFDVDVRGTVTDYLIPLAKVDAWIHWRLAELLKVAFTTGISMVREQMKLLSVLLTEGVRVDEHYDWTRRLAKAYNSIAQVRIHLQDLYRMSDLGKIALEDATAASETQGVAGVEALSAKPISASAAEASEGPGDRQRADEIREAVKEVRGEDGMVGVRPASSTSDTPDVEHPEQVWWEWQKWAQTLLETEDGILAPSVDTAVRVFVEEGDWQERTGKAARLLQAKFTRSHSICHKAAEWLLKLQAARDPPSNQEKRNEPAHGAEKEVFEDEQQLLTKYLLRAMEAAFDMEKADKVFLIDHSSEGSADQRSKSSDLRRGILEDFLSAFIKVPQFRQLIYTLSGQSLRAQASVFLSAMLRVICTSAEVKEGLKEVMAARVYAMNYIVFERTLQDKIRDFFQVVAEASKPVAPTRLSDNALGPALAEICQVCNFSEYTYFYSQAHLCCLAAAQKPLKHIFRHISEALTRTMKATKANRIWLLDMRFRGLGCHRKLFEELASIFMRWGKCEVTPHAAKSICGLLEDLLCPEVKRAWQKVKGETTGSSSEQRSLQDALAGWQRSFFSPPATRALMEWMFFNIRPDKRDEVARAAGWKEDEADKPEGVGDAVDAGSSGDGEEPRQEEDAIDEGSDGARTEAAGEEMDWEDLDEDFLLEQAAKDEPETEISQPETETSQPARSDASRSKRSGSQQQSSGRQTRNSQPSQMPSVLTASGYRMHAVSSQDAESNHGPVRGQDLEDIGAQSVLEFFQNPDFVEAVVRAFLKARHTKSTRSCFCRLLALITTDGLLEEENCKDEAKKPVFVAQTAVRELMAVYTQVQQKSKCIVKSGGKDSHHERKQWSQSLYVMMHLQATAVASLAGMIWLREEVLAQSLPQDELIERMSSGLPFMMLQRVVQRHPQKGEEVLSVLKHMMVLLGKDLIPEETGASGLEGAHRHQVGGGEAVGHAIQEGVQVEGMDHSWEAKKVALEETRDRICGRIVSMLLYLVMAHQLLLPILDCLHEVPGSLRPAALQLFLAEMLTVVPACERVFWSMARFLAQPEVLSLLEDEWPRRDEVCVAVERFCLAYDEVNLPARLPDQDRESLEPQVLRTAREETEKNVRLVQAKLRQTPEEALPMQVPESEPRAARTPEARPQAVNETPVWSASTMWSWFTGDGKARRGARGAPKEKLKKPAAKRLAGGEKPPKIEKPPKKKKRNESSLSSSESGVRSGEGTPILKDGEEDSRSDEDEINLDEILREGASAVSTSAAPLTPPRASQASSVAASKPRKADDGKRRKTVQEGHHRREGDRGSRRRIEDQQETRSDLDTCSVAKANNLQRDSFASAFAGVWQVFLAEERGGILQKGSCWGKAHVDPESCHFALPSGRRYTFKVHGEGLNMSPYTLISEKGNATLIDQTAKVLTWRLKKGHTMWFKEVAPDQPDNITELVSVAADAAFYAPEPLAPASLLCQSPETPPSPVPLEPGQDMCTSPPSQPPAPEGHQRSNSRLSSEGVSAAPTPGSFSALSSIAAEGLIGSGLTPQSVGLAGTAPASQLPRSVSSVSNTPTESVASAPQPARRVIQTASQVSNTPTESAAFAPQPARSVIQTARDGPPAPRRRRSLRIRVTGLDETPQPVSTRRSLRIRVNSYDETPQPVSTKRTRSPTP